jgi:hypothetical protein
LKGESNIHACQFVVILIVALAFFAIMSESVVLTVGDQVDVGSIAFQAFTGLADVYNRGGQAPDLVARLNVAINLAEQAKVKRENGDLAGAASLESQARAEMAEVISATPAAQQNAVRVSTTRTITAIVLIPISVIASTFVFYIALRTWKAYDRLRLYEMRIIEKKEAQD